MAKKRRKSTGKRRRSSAGKGRKSTKLSRIKKHATSILKISGSK